MRKPFKGSVEVDRFLIPYRIYGNGGPQLVMINGVRQSMGMWASFVRRFAENYRIILADLPGQRRSGHGLHPDDDHAGAGDAGAAGAAGVRGAAEAARVAHRHRHQRCADLI